MKKILILLAFLLVFIPKIGFAQINPNRSVSTYSGKGVFDKSNNTITVTIQKNQTGLKELKKGDFYFVISPTETMPSKLSEVRINKNIYLYGIGGSDVSIYSNTDNKNALDYKFKVVPNLPNYYVSIAKIDVTQQGIFNTNPLQNSIDSNINYVLLPYIFIKNEDQVISFTPAVITISSDKKSIEVKGGISLKNTTGYKIGYDMQPEKAGVPNPGFVNGVVNAGNYPKTVEGQFFNVFPIDSLTPGSNYYLRQFYYAPGSGTPVTDSTNYKFNTAYGAVLNKENSTTGTGQYRLLSNLAGFGLTDFYDPYSEVCQADPKQRPTGSFCSFNDFLNFLIKLGIALAAVMLVIKIMLEGFKYITTDIAGTKASAKANLTDAVVGLLIALTSYIILNTINPRLVNNTLELSRQNFLVSEQNDTSDQEIFKHGNTTVTASSCAGGLVAIPTQLKPLGPSTTDVICKTFADKLLALRSKTNSISWVITATTNGQHVSQCHNKNTPKTGNCVDIALRIKGDTVQADDPLWGVLCQAVNSTPGIAFINEASKTPNCQNIKPFSATKYGTGPHLHIISTD